MARYKSLLEEGKPIGLANVIPALDGETLDETDLTEMQETANYKGVRPYIAKGHDGITGGGAEGSYGWFDPSSITFDKDEGVLYATPEYVNPELTKEIEEGKYQKLSIEYSWVNFTDQPVYDKNNRKMSDNEAIIRWLWFGENLYNRDGEIANPRSIFKKYLKGVAVLGRATPAYPQFDIAEKVKTVKDISLISKEFKNVFVRQTNAILNKEINSKKEVKKLEDTLTIQKEDTQPDLIPVDETETEVNEVRNTISKKSKEGKPKPEFIKEGLRDAYDKQAEQYQRNIDELTAEIELLKTQKRSISEEKSTLEKDLINLDYELSRQRVYNLWLEYRSDGRLRREDLIDPGFDFASAMKEVRQILDPVQREIQKRKVNVDAVCSGSFFKDFNNGTEEFKQSMIRNIERKPKVLSEQKDYGKKESEKSKDFIESDSFEDKSKKLFRMTRELAQKDGINVDSDYFDVEHYRAKARLVLERQKGGY